MRMAWRLSSAHQEAANGGAVAGFAGVLGGQLHNGPGLGRDGRRRRSLAVGGVMGKIIGGEDVLRGFVDVREDFVAVAVERCGDRMAASRGLDHLIQSLVEGNDRVGEVGARIGSVGLHGIRRDFRWADAADVRA